MKTYILLLFFIIGTFSCLPKKPSRAGTFLEQDPIILQTKGKEIFQYWEGVDSPQLWEENTMPIPALATYRDSLKMIIGDSIFNGIVSRDILQLTPWPLENENHFKVHQGLIGNIRPINSLEAFLLNYQITNYPLLSHPTEFQSIVLKQPEKEWVRVYFAASDQPWPPKADTIIGHMENALAEGWEAAIHIHNHYEPDSNLYMGIMAPSMSDVQVLKWLRDDYGLQRVGITNGFTTVEIPTEDLDSLHSH